MTTNKVYDATKEFSPFPKKEKDGKEGETVKSANSHPRPRTGQTAKKKAKQLKGDK